MSFPASFFFIFFCLEVKKYKLKINYLLVVLTFHIRLLFDANFEYGWLNVDLFVLHHLNIELFFLKCLLYSLFLRNNLF